MNAPAGSRVAKLVPLVLLALAACSPSQPPAPAADPAAGAAAPAAAEAAAPPVPARAVEGLELSSCLATPQGADCPAWIGPAVASAAAQCREAGGKPAAGPGVAWSIDAQGDGKPEYYYEIGLNVTCEGAWSIFSCGSLGCPLELVAERDGAWSGIGGLYAPDPARVAVLPGPGPWRELEAGCLDGERCEESARYRWNGQAYEPVERHVRGVRVDVSGSAVHGLFPLVADTTVRALPSPDAESVGEYEAGREMAIVGQVDDWYYVSPCNACDSGFVAKSAVREQ